MHVKSPTRDLKEAMRSRGDGRGLGGDDGVGEKERERQEGESPLFLTCHTTAFTSSPVLNTFFRSESVSMVTAGSSRLQRKGGISNKDSSFLSLIGCGILYQRTYDLGFSEIHFLGGP